MKKHLRAAEKAGTWYADDPETLAAELDAYLSAAQPASATPLIGGIVPHAGLSYSGPTAAYVYEALRASKQLVETVLVFGAVHTMPLQRPALWPEGLWETPLGGIEVDASFAQYLMQTGLFDASCAPHHQDNAIELQTPFIKHCFPDAKILPVAMPPIVEAPEIGMAVAQVCQEHSLSVVVLGSTDLTHYGANFGHAPYGVGEDALRRVCEIDANLLGEMAAFRAENVIPLATQHHSACGAGAAAAATAFSRASGARDGRILHQTTSHEIFGGGVADTFVGYGAVAFYA